MFSIFRRRPSRATPSTAALDHKSLSTKIAPLIRDARDQALAAPLSSNQQDRLAHARALAMAHHNPLPSTTLNESIHLPRPLSSQAAPTGFPYLLIAALTLLFSTFLTLTASSDYSQSSVLHGSLPPNPLGIAELNDSYSPVAWAQAQLQDN